MISGTRNDRASDTSYVTVNAAPIADAGPDQVAAPGQVLTFDGSRSIDTDGDLTGFFWDFRDGSTALGSRVSHAFDRPGIYQVRLRVKDDTDQENAIDYDEARVVINAPPVANAGPDRLAGPGDKVIFDAAGSFDADGHISRYRWDFSDAVEPVFGNRVVRSYASPGVFTARLTVTDNSGVVNGTAQHEVTVRINHRPVANAGGDIFTSRSTVAFDGSQSADADGNPLLYTWDFGDGTPPVSGARVTHTYADGGRYPVVLKVDDGTGLHNATNCATITVVIDRPPLAAAGGNKQVCAGDVVVFDGTHSVDPEGGLLRYAWDFGDNTKSDIANPTKIYRQGGLYPVTLTVEDESRFRHKPAHRPHRRARGRGAARGRRIGSDRVRQQGGPLRRSGLARLRRRGQSLYLELRRRHRRRRGEPRARVCSGRQLSSRADHRGRSGRTMR